MPESTIDRTEATDTADSETKPSDIPGMCAEAAEFMHRSIGTKAGIACSRIREQAQQLRESHDRRS
jgi:hypothetical protein